MSERHLTSTEAAAWLGASPTSVKRWADAGLIECVRTAGNHRRFTLEALERFQSSQRPEAEEGESVEALDELDAWMQVLVRRNVDAVHGKLLLLRSQSGSWAEVCDRIGAVLVEMGARWVSGRLSIADEHIATERLLRGLARVADSLAVSIHAPVAMLMAAEGDEHTTGLALAEVALREAGVCTVFSGRNTPVEGLRDQIDARRIDLLVVSASSYSSDPANLARQLEALERACEGHTQLVIGGTGAWPDRANVTYRVSSFVELARVGSRLSPKR